jgi:hypothetical protein
MPFAEALPGWEDAYQAWLQRSRPLLEAAHWKDAFAG